MRFDEACSINAKEAVTGFTFNLVEISTYQLLNLLNVLLHVYFRFLVHWCDNFNTASCKV